MKNKTLIFFLTYILLLFNSVSCERAENIPEHLDHNFAYGTTKGLYKKSDFITVVSETATTGVSNQNKNYENILLSKENLYEENTPANIFNLNELLKITTASEGEKVKISSDIDDIFIDPNIPFLNEYQILDYTIEKPKTRKQKYLKELLGDTKFKGFPNTVYYILPHFFGNYLILYKLGSPDTIPYEELPLAKRVGNLLAVPLVGYAVEHCQAVRIRGFNNIKITRLFRPVCNSLQTAKNQQYIQLRKHKKQVFQYLKKMNFFQRDFFEGKWFYYQTLVRSPLLTEKEKLEALVKPASMVEFQPTIDKLDVVRVNDLRKEDERRMLFIPVRWLDYEIAKDSEQLDSNFLERIKEVDESQHPYLEIKFNELIRNEFSALPEGGKTLKSIVISKDYISFDMDITKEGLVTYQAKYAFKRYVENKTYKEKRWFEKDSFFFFPMYQVKREYYEKLTDHTKDDKGYFKRAVRFDPQKKEIVWHFSTQSPKNEAPWVRELGHLAINRINQAFKKAGKDEDYSLKLVLKDQEDKELGDIRYNILNLILSESDADEHFVRAKNVANPRTGEMISATANVWLTPILNEYIQMIRKYIRFHAFSHKDWKMSVFSKSIMRDIVNKNILNGQCAFSQKKVFVDTVKKLGYIKDPKKPLGVTPFFHEKIVTLCPKVINFIKKNQRAFKLGDSLQDNHLVRDCAQTMAQEKILQTILKNIFHSLGLKNMFASSVDSENFWTPKEITKLLGTDISLNTSAPAYDFSFAKKSLSHPSPPQYSSVMELMDQQYPILSAPGKLDIAALRFLYFDTVDLKNGKSLKVPSQSNVNPTQKNILETIDQHPTYRKQDLKTYKMCGPDNIKHGRFDTKDITCAKTVYGTNPIEITTNAICKIHNNLILNKKRYDAQTRVIDIPRNIKTVLTRIYDNWKLYRDHLLAEKNQSIEYYSFLNPQHVTQYQQIIDSITEPKIKAYHQSRQIIFDYVKRIIFAPSKHCIYKQEDGSYQAIALEDIEEKILLGYPDSSREEFSNCESLIVQKWAKEHFTNSEFVTEVGFFGKERRYLIRPNIKTDHIDESQSFMYFYRLWISPFDDMFQEPDIAKSYYEEWKKYVTKGMDLQPYMDQNIPLDRVLSYKIDTMEGIGDIDYVTGFANIWDFRLLVLKRLQETLIRDVQNQAYSSYRKHFYYQAFTKTQLEDLAESFVNSPGFWIDGVLPSDEEQMLLTTFPFLTQAYTDWLKKYPQDTSEKAPFHQFIQTHPAVMNYPEGNYRLPYADHENYILSQLYRKYNEWTKCIVLGPADCDQFEQKSAFIELLRREDDYFFQKSM